MPAVLLLHGGCSSCYGHRQSHLLSLLPCCARELGTVTPFSSSVGKLKAPALSPSNSLNGPFLYKGKCESAELLGVLERGYWFYSSDYWGEENLGFKHRDLKLTIVRLNICGKGGETV